MLEKDPAYQNDINEISHFIRATGLKTMEKKNFDLPNEIIESNYWQYKHFDMIEKKIKQCKIYSSFQRFYGRSFTFIHNSRNLHFVRFKADDLLLISTFDYDKEDYNMENYYRDFNSIFTFDYKKSFQWFGTSSMIIYYAMNEIVTKINNLDVNKFYKDWYMSLKST